MSKRTILLIAIGAIAALILGLEVAAFAALDNAGLPGSKFEIDNDANLRHDGPTPPAANATTDWADLADVDNPVTPAPAEYPELRAHDTQTGQTDNSYKGGVKEATECPAEDPTGGSVPNNKSDLLTFHVNKEAWTAPGDPGYMNLAWSRVSDPSGTTLMDFEFNQNDLTDDPQDPNDTCSKGPNVPRKDGDLLIE